MFKKIKNVKGYLTNDFVVTIMVTGGDANEN